MEIESFEKFISHKDRQLFVFERFISTVDRKINDIIWESLGVSPDVDSMVRKLVDEVNDILENSEYENVSDIDIDLIDNEMIQKSDLYRVYQDIHMGNVLFETDFRLMNYSGISDEEFDMVSTLNVAAFVKYVSSNRFKLTCYIPSRDFKMCDRGLSILEHEIMHSWQYHKKNSDGKKEKKYPEWGSSYDKATSLIKRGYGDIISKAIYYGDLRELCAFTQQAYYDLNKVNNIDDVDSMIRQLDIYKGMCAVRSGIEFLKNNEIPSVFSIDKKKLMMILDRRYDKYKKNIARLILMRKEVLEEDMEYIDITKDELMLMK